MLLTQAQACKKVNISRSIILNWEKQGLIELFRTNGKHRRYAEADLLRLLGVEQEDLNVSENNNYDVRKVYSEIASRINENRQDFNKMIHYVKNNDIKCIIIKYKDRLASGDGRRHYINNNFILG